LGWLGSGVTAEQIPDEHPDLEKADFPAVYQFRRRGRSAAQSRLSLLLDENLSPRLALRLASVLSGLIDVRDVGLTLLLINGRQTRRYPRQPGAGPQSPTTMSDIKRGGMNPPLACT
jgi:hypothetical protein